MVVNLRPERTRGELEIFTRKVLIVAGVAAIGALLWYARDVLLLICIDTVALPAASAITFADGVGNSTARCGDAASRPMRVRTWREAWPSRSATRMVIGRALGEASGVPAWTTIPSWDLIGTIDNVIPEKTQSFMAARAKSHATKVKAAHLSMVSQPGAVECVILDAVRKTS